MTALSRLDGDDLDLMLLIRHAERQVQRFFADGLVSGTTHTCIGQEYVPVALCTALRPDDFVFSNHRGHGHYLACSGDLPGLFAEILGRDGAPARGVGGSQHLRRGRYLSTGVQGQSMPVAVGTAVHQSRSEPGGLSCVYLGDGTWGEGAVYEALNLAALWRLPLLVVVEHNGIAQTTPTRLAMAGDIAGRAAAFGVTHRRIVSLDVAGIRAVTEPVVAEVRAGRPAVLEFVTHRVGPHSKGDDTRPAPERAEAAAHDWYELYRQAHPEHFAAHDDRQRALVAEVAAEVAGRALAR
ncbi:thiamine pyrophosphate-dependent dehydrogenase E1 component subunit alpha [Micromonospora sp. DT43]|uniref:thiamine pyrophosphate-dependent dehydrogenase E1 component subunit alpha n=1 Tax=Micromonospora sp. DT43 TaxID=3393440 RepID=UPI003CE780DF